MISKTITTITNKKTKNKIIFLTIMKWTNVINNLTIILMMKEYIFYVVNYGMKIYLI